MRSFLFFCVALFLTSCAARIYETAEIDTIAKKHTTIAVIQPKVDYRFDRPDHKNWRFVPSKEEIAAGVQLALTDWIKERQESGVLDITVIDPETTNDLMADISTADYSELAHELGVDAVLVSRFRYDSSFDYALWRYRFNDENPQSRIYLNLFTPEEGLIWSYERGCFHPSNHYNRVVFDFYSLRLRKCRMR